MATKAKSTNGSAKSEFQWPFGTRNYVIFALAVLVIVIGYIALGQGSITLAPLLLVIGYCVLVPLALIVRDPSKQARDTAGGPSGRDQA